MARPAHMLGRNQLTTVCEKDPARCLWVARWASVTCLDCLKHRPTVQGETN